MAELKQHEFKVDIDCQECADKVRKLLEELQDSSKIIEVNMKDQLVKVTTNNLTPDDVLKSLKKAGKQAKFLTSTTIVKKDKK